MANLNSSGANIGFQLASSLAPAFRANLSGTQTLTTTTFTKLAFATEVFDTNNNFDSTTNYRFTPTVAGYYHIQGGFYIATAATILSSIYKNGSEYSRGVQTASYGQSTYAAGLVYLNGSTDYVELYGYHSLGSNNDVNSSTFLTYFNGFLARSA